MVSRVRGSKGSRGQGVKGKSKTWFWVLGSGFWVLGSGFWVLGSGFWVLGKEYNCQHSKLLTILG